jgi:hypothetical protein
MRSNSTPESRYFHLQITSLLLSRMKPRAAISSSSLKNATRPASTTASTSIVARTASARGSVMSRPAIEPPTNTSWCRRSPRASAISRSCARFGSFGSMCSPELAAQHVSSQRSLTSPTASDSIQQRKEAVQVQISKCCIRRCSVQRRDGWAFCRSMRMWPHGFITWRHVHLTGQGLRTNARRYPSLYRPQGCGPHIFHSMQQELQQRRPYRLPAISPVRDRESALDSALNACMRLGRTHGQRCAQLSVSPAPWRMCGDLEQNNQILRLEFHSPGFEFVIRE